MRGWPGHLDLDKETVSLYSLRRVNHRHIPQAWIIRPDFQHWPPQGQSAVLWIMAHLVQYRLLTQRRLSFLDYVDFMRRAR